MIRHGGARAHGRRITELLAAAFGNRALRRVLVAYAGFNAAEWGVWLAVLVYAYGHGGAAAAGLAAVVQLVPAGLFAPFAARLADRDPPARVLTLGYLAQSAAMALAATALFAGAPPAIVYGLAAIAASATTFTRPAQAALVPSLVRTIDELTAANVVSNWIESVSLLTAPALTGVLLAVGEPGAVFAVMAAAAAASALVVAPLRGPPAPPAEDHDGGAARGALAAVAAGLLVAARHPPARMLMGLLFAEFVLIGALDVLFVVLAVELLGLGGAGAGYLNAGFGAGGVLAIAVTVALVGRSRLAPALVLAGLGWSVALLGLGLWPTVLGAFALLAGAGAARAVLDVATRTLLQRAVPGDVLARVFGVLETLDAVGLALGSILAPLLVAVLGPQGAVAALAALLPVLLGLASRRLRTIDAHADVPVVEIALLRTVPIFAALSGPALERLARGMTPLALRAGEVVLREGQPGSGYHVVAGGELEVSRGGAAIAIVARGDGVGEISLLAGVPCIATVAALTDAQLYTIAAQPFLEVVTGHAASERVAQRLVRERLVAATASDRQASSSAST